MDIQIIIPDKYQPQKDYYNRMKLDDNFINKKRLYDRNRQRRIREDKKLEKQQL